MRVAIRQLCLLTLAAALSWWTFLYSPHAELASPRPADLVMAVALTPILDGPALPNPRLKAMSTPEVDPQVKEPPSAALATVEPAELAPTPEHEPESEPAPPPPELGDPEGEREGQLPAESANSEEESLAVQDTEAGPEAPDAESEPAQVEKDSRSPSSADQLMRDPDLLAVAEVELSGEVRQGFATVLLASPEEQLEIARYFGEELVLVPRQAMDPATRDPKYFRLSNRTAEVEAVRGRPALESFRQYRDIFDYEYARLPARLRELRRSVLSRSEIFLFAALIPRTEWAVVVGRRRQALSQSGRTEAEVRRILLRYEQDSSGSFDVRVVEIAFTDGERLRPGSATKRD